MKNAYDADASVCLIKLQGPLSCGAGTMLVIDDGHGMSAETLATAWLDLATTAKRTNRTSESGQRRLLGEKGVGRLAAARLARSLLVTTRRQLGSEVEMLVDWTEFDQPNAYLDEIEVAWAAGESKSFSVTGEVYAMFTASGVNSFVQGQGTCLRMDELTANWDTKAVADLRRSLERLVPPPYTWENHNSAAGFRIFLQLDEEFSAHSGEVGSPEALNDPLYQLTGSIREDGHAELTYTQEAPPLSKSITVNLWADSSRAPECGPFEIRLRVWDRDRAGIAMAAPGMGVRDFRQMLDPLAGVSVYRDGFRVFPFGERGDDWLGLDARRVNNPTLRLSNNQIIGHVHIMADENSGLQDQSNREGLQDGPAYEDFRDLVIGAIAEIETRRKQTRGGSQPRERHSSSIFDSFNLDDVVAASRQGGASEQVMEIIAARQQEIASGVQRVQEVISRFQLLATLGQLVDRVVHDGRNALGPLRNK
ncbi:MAG: ATP-binding protein, partial [Cyclobacteriaceae bacterium]